MAKRSPEPAKFDPYEVTLYGRIWVTPEGQQPDPMQWAGGRLDEPFHFFGRKHVR